MEDGAALLALGITDDDQGAVEEAYADMRLYAQSADQYGEIRYGGHQRSLDSRMTPADLRRWQAELGLTYDTAAKVLAVNRSTYARWLSGESAIPGPVDLACAAVAVGLAPYSQCSVT